jgi:hypothetical protein
MVLASLGLSGEVHGHLCRSVGKDISNKLESVLLDSNSRAAHSLCASLVVVSDSHV